MKSLTFIARPSVPGVLGILALLVGLDLSAAEDQGAGREMSLSPRLVPQLGHTSRIVSLALSPDGGLLLSGGEDKSACLWETRSGREIRRFEGHAFGVHSVAFSRDGRRILTGCDLILQVWDAETGRRLQKFEGDAGSDLYYQAVALSPDGRFVLASFLHRGARLWEVETGKLLRSLDEINSNRFLFSAGGRSAFV